MTRKTRITMPTPEEDARITAAAEADPDNPPWPDEMIRTARRGRPPLPAAARKQQVTVMLDRDVIEALKAGGSRWQTRLNSTVRKALGLPARTRGGRRGGTDEAA
jgi:uncharacterized protein (DUF4415 family)